MKGLLYMDFTVLRRRYWYVFLMAALFGAMYFSERNVTFFTLYPYLLLALPLLLISSILYAASWLASAAVVARRER